jgi:hypothetical protein
MNLTNKVRLTKDIVVYENFINEETCQKMIEALDAYILLRIILICSSAGQ